MSTDEQHSVKADTEYVVLRRNRAKVNDTNSTVGKPEQWEVVATVASRSADAAVKEVAARPEVAQAPNATTVSGAQVLVAVPARSWKPAHVTAKVETTFVLTEATDAAA